MNYDIIKFHEVLYALGIRGWKIPTAPETEEYFLANFERRTGMGTNDMGEPMAVFSSNSSDFGVTWSQITAKHAELVTEYDGNAYQRTRADAYAEVKEQLDLLYHDMAADKGDKTGTWFAAIKAVKDATPKP